MTSLHDELAQLTATQPAQPGDRLAGVTGRARRIRRTRAAAAALSVVAVLGIGATLAVGGLSRPVPTEHLAGDPGSPISQWSDRSDPSVKHYSKGAVAGWKGGAQDVRWVYRGVHHGNNASETNELVMVFRAKQAGVARLVTATVDRTKVDHDGYPLSPDRDSWTYRALPLTAGSPRNVVLSYQSAGDTDVFVLEAPTARTLTWKVTPLPHAAEATTQTPLTDGTGTNRSARGVFGFHVGKVLGRMTYSVSGNGKTVSGVPLPETAGVLADADSPPIHGTFQLGSPGQLDGAGGGFATSIGTPASVATSQVSVRCYGGGTLTIEVYERAAHVPCDGVARESVLQTGPSQVTEDRLVQLTTDRLTAYSLVVYSPS